MLQTLNVNASFRGLLVCTKLRSGLPGLPAYSRLVVSLVCQCCVVGAPVVYHLPGTNHVLSALVGSASHLALICNSFELVCKSDARPTVMCHARAVAVADSTQLQLTCHSFCKFDASMTLLCQSICPRTHPPSKGWCKNLAAVHGNTRH